MNQWLPWGAHHIGQLVMPGWVCLVDVFLPKSCCFLRFFSFQFLIPLYTCNTWHVIFEIIIPSAYFSILYIQNNAENISASAILVQAQSFEFKDFHINS